MAGVEQTLVATGMGIRRMTDDEMFVEAKRGSESRCSKTGAVIGAAEYSIDYRSARSRSSIPASRTSRRTISRLADFSTPSSA